MYEKFPEMLLVDATYKLIDLRIPVYLLLVIDGDGLSEMAALIILADNTKPVIESVVNIFKKYNHSWEKTVVIMSVKVFNERDAFSNCFPSAKLLICLYHTLRSLRREVTCEKICITSTERSHCLEILQAIAYSNTEDEYNSNVNVLRNTKIKSVIDYCQENWLPVKEQCMKCFKS